MRVIVGVALAAACLAACKPSSEKTNPAVATEGGQAQQASSAPAAGANSFTEAQAKGRIESAGYADVTGLSQDDQGLWHGQATKDGKPVQVSVDYQGNVTTK
jgi:hypothetical protein